MTMTPDPITAPSGAARIRHQIVWSRLIAIVEEQARTLIRAGFSTSTREAGDVSAGVFDPEGRMLAQALTGTPGHINSMARSVKHFLDVFPVSTMRPGDAYITNDPWKATGHLHDFSVVTPLHRDGQVVALFACTTHVVDIGGNGPSPDSGQVYQEGLFVPIMKIASEGVMNDSLLQIVRSNVREPVQVEGDIYALVACNDMACDQLGGLLTEYAMPDLAEVGGFILAASGKAMREAITALPDGTWTNRMRIDGYEDAIDIVATLTVKGDHIHVDYTGTSGLSRYGINCPMSYTEAYTAFGVKCVIAPGIPNNSATLDCVTVSAPEDCIANAPFPCAVVARSTIGQMLPDVVLGCLHQALPETVPAESTGTLWNLRLGAAHGLSESRGAPRTPFMVTTFHSGGAGARPMHDGLSATPFPSGIRNVPIEITESITPLVVWRKELRVDSGGAGRQRGGLGQVMEVASREDAPFTIFARFERVENAPRGREGGTDGAAGRISLVSGGKMRPKGVQIIPAGDRLVVEMPGGGGFGPAADRDLAEIGNDLRRGYITPEAARRDYGITLGADGKPLRTQAN